LIGFGSRGFSQVTPARTPAGITGEPVMAKVLPHLITFLVVVAAIKIAPRLPG
jgi:hypothetical protein